MTNDTLGSPRVTTDSSGNVVSRRDFRPYGEEISRPNQGTDKIRQKFTSYERDNETNLDFAQARMYNKNHGRFTSFDQLMESALLYMPQSFNRYAYCLNNPLNIIDPSGMIWLSNDGGKNHIWVEDKDYKDKDGNVVDKYKDYTVTNGAVYILGGGTGIDTSMIGSYVVNNANGMISLAEPSQIPISGAVQVISEADEVRINESPLTWVRTGQITERSNTLRSPDYVTVNYSALTTGHHLTMDACGNVYTTPFTIVPRMPVGDGPGVRSFMRLGGNISFGWLNQRTTPTGEQMQNFLTGPAINASFGTPKLIGGGLTYSPGNGTATELGVYTPGAGVSGNGSFLLTQRPSLGWRKCQ